MMRYAMRLWLAAALVVGLLPAPPGRAGEEDRVPGALTLADGTVHLGILRTTVGKPLRLFDLKAKRRFDLRLTEIQRLRVHVAKEEQYRIWRWVEDGSREKVFTGESYPMREYETEITLTSGEVRRGHLVGVLYLYPKGKNKPLKFILRHKDKGEIGETLSDLSYVETLVLDTSGTEGKGASIRLTVTPADLLVAAHALPRGRDRSVEGRMSRTPGVVTFPSLIPDVYDLAVVSEERIDVALFVGKDGAKPPDEATMKLIRERANEIVDFFEVKEVLAAVQSGAKIRALVRKSRTGKTSMGGDRTFRRWEVWSMHKGGDRWLVDHRSFVFREHGEGLPAPRQAVLAPALGGHAVKSGVTQVAFAIPGEKK